MGDSETVAARTATYTAYSAVTYSSASYGDGNPIPTHEAGVAGEPVLDVEFSSSGKASFVSGAREGNLGSDATHASQGVLGKDGSFAVSSSGAAQSLFPDGNTGDQSMLNDNGDASQDSGIASTEQIHEDASVPALSAEEERLWSIVRANSLDFDAWVALIDETEKGAEGNILKIRRAYDAFLAEFPLCYGYWKKYAEHEASGSTEKAIEVYERAVLSVTYSVDIWLYYCRFVITKYEDPEVIRRLFERGLAYVGTDYLSYSLWDEYIEYEYKQQQWCRLAVIYTRIFETPILYLDKYWNSFKELAANRPLSELRTIEEAANAENYVQKDGDHGDTGRGSVEDTEQTLKPSSEGLTEAQQLEKFIALREETYKKAKEFDSKILGFETAIGRPYFHVKPLNVAELENWHNYLNFIESEGDFTKIFKLYERCLIACASYPEYWIRYIKCMEGHGSMDLAENALLRATQVFVKRQPEIHLFSAWFKEHRHDVDGARAAYQLVHTEISPGLLEAIIKHSNMERRLGNIDNALAIYEQAIAVEKGKEHSQALPVLFAHYARFLYLVPGKLEKAREILVQASEPVQLSKPFLETMICLETMLPFPKRIEFLDTLIEKFLTSNMDGFNSVSFAEREELSNIFLEFLDLVGEANNIRKAHERHIKLFLHGRANSQGKKRNADDFLQSDRAKLMKSDALVSSTTPPMGTYPNIQGQWAAGYGLQQTWPQVAQTPVQQWNPGYAQQPAAYSGYSTSYATPQVPASVPQPAAYGAYTPTYPVQAAPQHSYVQPAVAAAAAPPQQAASAPQAYYGTYY
ncbi:hypothetical protein MLD38_020236 [Melastoma candidum]|uniref:Uncharacterized protein n=1 Tax=Melastoma candidum TaxID=119954 RepID=A0ACB9QG21_9MYRT|nr:hypothetical protein MLD38_020236 [Melastoma candidum]